MSHSPDIFDPHGAQKPGAPDSIDAMAALKAPFGSDDWFVNLMLGLVCMIIPVVGPIVFLGYEMELIEGWLKQPGKPYPRLDFGRFTDYLKRGVWPFLAALIGNLVTIPLTLVIMLPFFCLFFGSGAFMGDDDTAILGVVCMLSSFLVLFVGIIVVNVVGACIVTPMMLAAGLSGEIGPALDFAFVKDFLSRTWKDMCKAYLFAVVVGTFVSLLGYCVFVVGFYVALAYLSMVSAHLFYQAYALYLARGGKPIRPKVEMAGNP